MLRSFHSSTLYRVVLSFDIFYHSSIELPSCVYVLKMNTRRNADRRVEESAAGGNQAPHQAPSAGVQVPVNPAALTDGEVKETLVQMAQAITTQEEVITA